METLYPTSQLKSSTEATAHSEINKNRPPTYSKVVNYGLFPKKNQAIIIDTIDGIEVKTYLKAIATKTCSTNIVAASKISQNRFCCYLNTEQLVEDITREGNNIIEIEGHKLKIRPYVTKTKRVILSNVHPYIPHDEIILKLKEKGVTPKSRMSFIRLGFDDPGFTQILSFRRQIFINPEDIDKIPKEFTLNYEDTIHHIYATTDKITCFSCHKEGHTSKYCTATQDDDNNGTLTTVPEYTQVNSEYDSQDSTIISTSKHSQELDT